MKMSRLARDGTGLPNPSRETKFSGTNADREIFIFSVQLATCRTDNLTRLILTFAIRVTIHRQKILQKTHVRSEAVRGSETTTNNLHATPWPEP